jgi:pimeloyl-ACP methyl ester carboxylesterase
MQYAVKELVNSELPGITLKNEYYLIGYSQGGWATLALHKALELDYAEDFNLRGSACGAGPYDIYLLMQEIMNVTIYPMPVYLGYIVNAYINYNQFSNPVTDIFNEPYASKISSLYNGLLTSEQINNQLTTSITELVNPGFYSDFTTAAQYSSIRDALSDNSITAWHSYKPLFLFHGEEDRSVSPVSTENMYTAMIQAGTTADICSKVIIPGVGHSEAAIPGLMQGILFINNLKSSE